MDVELTPETARYAILIGIDKYREKPLRGAVRDVRNIRRILDMDPTPVHIRLFSAPRDDDTSSTQINLDDQALRPTYANITKAITEVTLQSNAGDLVYIHFAGHGTRRNPGHAYSNNSTGDLALVLLDETPEPKERCLFGYILAFSLKAMVDKGLVVTLVLDCCFSASVYRGDPSVRYVEYNPDWDLPQSTDGVQLDLGHVSTSGTRDASFSQNWLVDPNGYAILAACQPDQQAKELLCDDNQIHGALSHILFETLSELGGLGGLHKDVFRNLSSTFRKQKLNQHPTLFGNGEQPFFSSKGFEIRKGLIGVFQSMDGNYVLQAGQAHGVRAGDQFVLFPHDRSSTEGQAVARVITARSLTSDLELSEAAMIAIQKSCDAKTLTQSALQNMRVKLAPGIEQLEAWFTALEKRSLGINTSDEGNYAFHVSLGHSEYEILDEFNQRVSNLPVIRRDENIGYVCNLIQHLAKCKLVRDLVNETPNNAFNESFKVWVTHKGNQFPPNSALEVQHNEKLLLHVENIGDERFFLHVYDLSPMWEIQNGLCQSPRFIPSKTSGEGFNSEVSVKLQMKVPQRLRDKGVYQCEDVVKIFITSQYTLFDSSELPEIGHSGQAELEDGRIRQVVVDGPEEWVALSFTVRTVWTR